MPASHSYTFQTGGSVGLLAESPGGKYVRLRMSRYTAAVLAMVAFASGSSVCRAAIERFSIMANHEKVGHVVAVLTGPAVDIDFAISDNGRGPQHQEHLVLSPNGMPTEWSIEGTSLMGGAVTEHASWKSGVQSWSSQADRGEVQSAAPRLYIGNDASPWTLGLYARLLLKAPEHSLEVLPAGKLKLEKLRQVSLGEGGAKVTLNAWLLSGIDLTPEVILLDQQQRLFAHLSSQMAIREGYEKHYAALRTLGESLTLERLEAIQKRVAHSYDAPIRFRNVRIFDPQSKALSPPASVVVYRGVISTVEPDSKVANTASEVTVDGHGGTLIAGLHDMHSHNSLWSGPFYLAAGVTTVRDMGNDNPVLLDLIKRLDAGDLPGPHIIPSGLIEGRSPFSARIGVIPESLDEGSSDVRWYADRGYLQIKIYNSMNPDWVKPLAAQAHSLGLRVVGHVPAFTTPDRMIADGYDEITHINQLMLGWLLDPKEDTRTPLRLTAMSRAADLDLASPRVRNTIELMKSHHTGLDTTAVILERLMLSRAGQVAAGDAPYLEHMPIGYQRYRKRSFVSFKDDAEKARYDRAFAKIIDTLTLLNREGIRLWPGTDDATGFTVHRELELYTQAALSAADTLRRATFDCDQYLNRDQQYGSLERGKRADFFLIPGDPLQDISAVRQIELVMKDGVIYYPQEIYRELGITPFASAPPISIPKETLASTAAASAHWMSRSAFGDSDESGPAQAVADHPVSEPNPGDGSFNMTLRPVRDSAGEVTAIEVSQQLSDSSVAASATFSLAAPVTYAAVTGVADRIKSLDVRDAAGPIALRVEEDKPAAGGFPYYRHWRATRAVTSPITIKYTALVQPPGSPNGPAFGIRPAAGGVSGSGGGFLLLPENVHTTVSHVRWDLSGLAPGSIGVTTFGEGAFDLPGDPSELAQGWMMAGPLQHYSAPNTKSRFGAFWLGDPPFDAPHEMGWVAEAYAYLGKSFRYLDPVPDYRVFMRALDTPPFGGGTALGNSFMLSMGEGNLKGSIEDTRETFFHEMSHQWVGQIEGSPGEIAWFVEGLNVYYTLLLPLRGGLVPVDEYALRLNKEARNYYESPARNWSAAKIAAVGFGNEQIRHTPYVRGALYFSNLDWQIRRKSHGKRNLDAFLYPMFVARQKGARFDQAVWESMLTRELGPEAVKEFRAALIEGTRTLEVAAPAFGPCFKREAVSMKSGTESTQGYHWTRVRSVPDARCRNW